MHHRPVCCAGTTPAITYAKYRLEEQGISTTEIPRWDTGHLLLDVPSFRPGSSLCKSRNLDTLLSSLPRDVTIWGGNLDHPALEGFRTVDLLHNEIYLAENAAITAHCTVKLVSPLLTATWAETSTLIIGWGRIGKCLARLLRDMGCPVTVAVRSTKDLATLRSLDYRAIPMGELHAHVHKFRLIINTAPVPVLEESCCPDALKIDLASNRGIAGENVVWARGLPGIHAPESSGKLIADTFLQFVKEVTP